MNRSLFARVDEPFRWASNWIVLPAEMPHVTPSAAILTLPARVTARSISACGFPLGAEDLTTTQDMSLPLGRGGPTHARDRAVSEIYGHFSS